MISSTQEMHAIVSLFQFAQHEFEDHNKEVGRNLSFL